MPRFTITPWRNRTELLIVRDQFYPPPSYDGPDLRRDAVGRITVWKLRGKLPHFIESTGLLMDALLNDDAKERSILSIRTAYSGAFCRFITGATDSERRCGRKMAMVDVGRRIGLPVPLVNLRHEATHEDLPSLSILRKAVKVSLQWLWDNYWLKLDPRTRMLVSDAHKASISIQKLAQVKYTLWSILCKYKSDQMAYFSCTYNTVKAATADDTQKTSKVGMNPGRKRPKPGNVWSGIVEILKNDYKYIRALALILLENDFLVPSHRILSSSMFETFEMWEDLVRIMCQHHRSFMSIFIQELVLKLGRQSGLKAQLDPYREAVFLWLERILVSSDKWISLREMRKIQTVSIIKQCLNRRNCWDTQLAKDLISNLSDNKLKKRFERAYRMHTLMEINKKGLQGIIALRSTRDVSNHSLLSESRSDDLEQNEHSPRKKRKVKRSTEEVSELEQNEDSPRKKRKMERSREESNFLESCGWKMVNDWVPNPIGVI